MNKKEFLAIIKLEDKGQDFLELRIKENGVINGYSPIFSHDRNSLLGIGKLDGEIYYSFQELKDKKFKQKLKGLYIYLKETEEKDPLPWTAKTLKYKII